MDPAEFDLQIRARRVKGEWGNCTHFPHYHNELDASMAAAEVADQVERKTEAYPCYFCGGWHAGWALTEEEREQFS